MNPTRPLPRVLLTGLLALAILALGWTALGNLRGEQQAGALTLARPLFLLEANAQGLSSASFLEKEAGMSVYFKAQKPLDLTTAAKAYRTVEVQAPDYLIGSVAIPKAAENKDVHVYVHRSGWMVAYYPAARPAAASINAAAFVEEKPRYKWPTHLETALSLVAAEAGVVYENGAYYDFRYPTANRFMIIGEHGSESGAFRFNLPDTLTYFERGWYVDQGPAYLDLDDVRIYDTMYWKGDNWGVFTQAQTVQNKEHLFTNNSKAFYGLALVYKVP